MSDNLADFDKDTNVGSALQECGLSWIEIKMIDENDVPVQGERFKIQTSDNKVKEGKLDSEGFARCEGIKKGSCKISFPDLDKDTWEKI